MGKELNSKMKLLIVTPFFSVPPVRGYEVILNKYFEKLSQSYSIDLITFDTDASRKINVENVKHLFNSIYIINHPRWKSLINSFFGLFTTEPLQVRFYRSRKMTIAINQLLSDNKYEVAVFQMARMAQFLPKNYCGKTVLNMVDPMVLNFQRSLTWRSWYFRVFLSLEISRLRRYETEIVKHFDRITLIAEADIKDYKSFLNIENIDWAPYGIDIDYFQPNNTICRQSGMILISGNMGYAPNIDGVKNFCREVFPLILEKKPEATLWIVGTNPSREIKNLSNQRNIIVTGFVNDIRLYLNRAMVSICPIKLNVGTQTKVLEALAMGTPVVTTTQGNHGINGDPGRDLYVADDPNEIAQYVVDLLKGNKWEELSENGRRFVGEKFRWETSVKKFQLILDDLIYTLPQSTAEQRN